MAKPIVTTAEDGFRFRSTHPTVEPGAQLFERFSWRAVGGIDDEARPIPGLVLTVDDLLPGRPG
jgi:hypothetical protein